MKNIQLLIFVIFVTSLVNAMNTEKTAQQVIKHLHLNCTNQAHEATTRFLLNDPTRQDLLAFADTLSQAQPKRFTYLHHAGTWAMTLTACSTLLQSIKLFHQQDLISSDDIFLLGLNVGGFVASTTFTLINIYDHWAREGEFEKTQLQILQRINTSDGL